MRSRSVIPSPVGPLTLTADQESLLSLHWGTASLDQSSLFDGESKSPLLQAARLQLDEYFAGQRKIFDLPLAPQGTAFQKRVWEELLKIPYGEFISYGELAERIGNPKASRAVGAANGRNPLGILIPCHRVLGSTGLLTGFAGGLDVKSKLLTLEGLSVQNDLIVKVTPKSFSMTSEPSQLHWSLD